MKIVDKNVIAQTPDTRIVQLEISSPDIAQKALPGQFVVLMVSEKGERIPLTVVEKDTLGGTITLIFQEVGFTTRLLGKLNKDDALYALVGPLGNPTEIANYGKVILVGGGVGIAEIYPVAKALRDKGNHINAILGARTKELLILEKKMQEVSDEVWVTTDDGSYGRKGLVTEVLNELLDKQSYNLVYAVGPIPMMKNVSQVATKHKVRTIVSLNALMVDATGMCGCCRVTVGGQTKFSCVDGPEFEGAQVDWDELIKRNRAYLEQERHICKLPLP